VKADIHAAMYATTRSDCVRLLDGLADRLGRDHPRAVASLRSDRHALLAFFDFPAEHAKHLRTTNPIESTFSTVKLWTRTTRGAGSRRAGLAMAFPLIRIAEQGWRRLDAAHLLALVRAGTRFVDGRHVERDDQLKPKKPGKDAA
jgi:transposase-like protein